MILFFSETHFLLSKKRLVKNWLYNIIKLEKKKAGDINFVFYNDEQLLALNKLYLNHDTLTDIITFNYSEKKVLNADICISVERVLENSKKYNCNFEEELRRVMAHGILHLCDYNDKKLEEKQLMKQKEEEALLLFKTHCNY